jgi:hypothetical protein
MVGDGGLTITVSGAWDFTGALGWFASLKRYPSHAWPTSGPLGHARAMSEVLWPCDPGRQWPPNTHAPPAGCSFRAPEVSQLEWLAVVAILHSVVSRSLRGHPWRSSPLRDGWTTGLQVFTCGDAQGSRGWDGQRWRRGTSPVWLRPAGSQVGGCYGETTISSTTTNMALHLACPPKPGRPSKAGGCGCRVSKAQASQGSKPGSAVPLVLCLG